MNAYGNTMDSGLSWPLTITAPAAPSVDWQVFGVTGSVTIDASGKDNAVMQEVEPWRPTR